MFALVATICLHLTSPQCHTDTVVPGISRTKAYETFEDCVADTPRAIVRWFGEVGPTESLDYKVFDVKCLKLSQSQS